MTSQVAGTCKRPRFALCALPRLCFILAVATLYVTAQGVNVVASGQRRRVAPHWFRGNSYFRIGWDWRLIDSVCFTHVKGPQPAMASRKQHDQRTYRIEFEIRTYQYASD
jgi:hypothetical protein